MNRILKKIIYNFDEVSQDPYGPENNSMTSSQKKSDSKKTRLVLYSHDTMGLGHIRRNLLIAQSLQLSPMRFDILLITGAKEAGQFALPKDADRVILPSLYKNRHGGYSARHLSLELDDIIQLRSSIIESAVRAFNPDIMIVDNVARGACGELDKTLEHLEKQNRSKLVLGMRDIKDEPSLVEKEWRKEGFENTIERYYDEIWVYGDRNVYDVAAEYDMKPRIANKVQYTGYLDHRTRVAFTKEQGLATRQLIDTVHRPYVLCMVGGGQDGLELAEAFLNTRLDQGLNGIVLTGPHMSRQERGHLFKLATASSQMQVIDFVSEPTLLLKDAKAVVSMGGYNGVSEILSFEKHALIVPRIKPRQEQLIRAEELSKRGVVDYIRPDALSPQALEQWIAKAVKLEACHRDESIDMDGLKCIHQLLDSLINRQETYSSLATR